MNSRSELTRRQLLHTALAAPVVSAVALRTEPLAAAASSVLSQPPAAASHLHSPL